MRFFPLAALFSASLLLAGCSDSGDAEQATEIPATTAPASADPYAVPEVIDVAYVDRVLGEIWHTRDTVTQSVATNRAFTPEDEAKLRSLYSGPLEETQVEIFRRGAEQEHDEAVTTEFSVVDVQRLIEFNATCVYAEAQVSGSGGSHLFGYVLDASEAAAGNETGWTIRQGTLPDQIDQSSTC